MSPNDFRQLFSRYAHCAPEQFAYKVFWRVLYFHAIPAAVLIRLLVPDYFRLDLETIEGLGQTESAREFTCDLDRYRFLNGEKHSLLRSLLFIRISGKKLVRLRRKVERTLDSRQESGVGQLNTARQLDPTFGAPLPQKPTVNRVGVQPELPSLLPWLR